MRAERSARAEKFFPTTEGLLNVSLGSVTGMTAASGCYACVQEQMFDQLPVRERIAFDQNWRVAHTICSALEAWLVCCLDATSRPLRN
jgi:hypothetical protein